MPLRFTATNLLILLNGLMFLFQGTQQNDTAILGINRLFVDAGFWWQPLSSMFVHGGLLHLAMNMAVLYQVGTLIERVRGAFYFLLLYLIGGLATTLLSFLFFYGMGWNHTLVGASGAISVLLGWIARLDPFQRQDIVVTILLISFLPLLSGVPIAWYAHLIGFGIGWLVASVKPR
jgi:membrane associated rhomboid family serine protease